ncbi:MAG: RNA methyltransferase [Armatimonadota bacterium]
MPTFRVVLVEPRDPRNVGMVARAMANLGFSDLALVAPRNWDPEQAGVTARNAASIVAACRIVDRFEEAIDDCDSVAGFALREGIPANRRTDVVAWAAQARTGGPGTAALVFGPEDDDLRNAHLDRCRHVVRIPTRAEFPSFNLAQSVLVALWELTRAPSPTAIPANAEALPTPEESRVLATLVERSMDLSGFRRPGSPVGAARTVAAWLARADLDASETRAMTALFGRISSALGRVDNDESS